METAAQFSLDCDDTLADSIMCVRVRVWFRVHVCACAYVCVHVSLSLSLCVCLFLFVPCCSERLEMARSKRNAQDDNEAQDFQVREAG